MAITFTPGQNVAAPDWEALFAQHGGAKSSVIRPPTKTENDALAADDDYDQNPIYRYYAEDGSYVEARKSPSGDYQIVAYQPSEKFKQSQSGTNRTDAEWHTEGTPDASKPGGYDNDRPIMVRTVNGVRQTRALDDKELRSWNNAREMSRNPGGKTDAEMQAQGQKDDTTVVDVSYTGTGKSRQKVTTYKSGRKVTEASPTDAKVKETTYRPDGTKVTTYEDGTTTIEAASPAETRAAGKDDFPVEPDDLPPLNMTPAQVAQGLQRYSAALAAKVKLWKESGGKQGISPQDATKLMDNRIKLAEAAGRESSNLAQQQQGIYNGQVNQRGQTLGETASRRGDANTAYNNNLARFVPQMTMMGPGGGQLVANALTESLNNNTAYVNQWGGFRESPEIQTPGFLQQIRDASMAGINTAASGGPVLTGAAGMPPAAPSQVAPADPAMAEAARQQQAAAGAATGLPVPQTPPPPPPAVNPVGGQPITVPVTPGASESGLIPPAVNPVTGEPTGLSPLPGASDPQPSYAKPDDRPTFLPEQPPELAPFQDEQRQPGYGFPLQTTVESPAQPGDLPLPPPGTLPQSMSPSFLSQPRFGTAYDPRQRAAMLGIRPDILELALAG